MNARRTMAGNKTYNGSQKKKKTATTSECNPHYDDIRRVIIILTPN